MKKSVRVLGIHPIAANEPVHLIEIEVEGGSTDFNFGEITQEVMGEPQSNWQVAYDEREIGVNRFVFFFHYLDATLPLLSPVGPLVLPAESLVPPHLKKIPYEEP